MPLLGSFGERKKQNICYFSWVTSAVSDSQLQLNPSQTWFLPAAKTSTFLSLQVPWPVAAGQEPLISPVANCQSRALCHLQRTRGSSLMSWLLFCSSQKLSRWTWGGCFSPPDCPRCAGTRTRCWLPCSVAGTTSPPTPRAGTSSTGMAPTLGMYTSSGQGWQSSYWKLDFKLIFNSFIFFPFEFILLLNYI